MLLKSFTVYDSKAEIYLKPFFMGATGEAIRAFEDQCNNPETQFYAHAGDFTLFEIGVYDDNTGRFAPLDAFINLGTALEYKKEK